MATQPTQFFMDYELYGMETVSVRKWTRRAPSTAVTTCALEVDVHVDDIERTTAAPDVANPGVRFIWEDERARRVKLDLPPLHARLPSQVGWSSRTVGTRAASTRRDGHVDRDGEGVREEVCATSRATMRHSYAIIAARRPWRRRRP